MKKALGLAVSLLAVSGLAQAQAPFAVVSASADYDIPANDQNSHSFATHADWVAAGSFDEEKAVAHGGMFDPPQNIAIAEASFLQPDEGLAVARGLGESAAFYRVGDPIAASTSSEISSQFVIRVTREVDSPMILSSFTPVHGLLSCFDGSQSADYQATASAEFGFRFQSLSTPGDLTYKGSIAVRSLYQPTDLPFVIETDGFFRGADEIVDSVADPQKMYPAQKAAQISQLFFFDLPDAPQYLGQSNDYGVTFYQKIQTGLVNADSKMAWADFRDTAGFEIIARDPITGDRIDNAIKVEILGGSGTATAPEPSSLTLCGVLALPLVGVLRSRRRIAALR